MCVYMYRRALPSNNLKPPALFHHFYSLKDPLQLNHPVQLKYTKQPGRLCITFLALQAGMKGIEV